jgi:aryl-alcohol dehydrogenase-like predicted oxidoreductase
MEIPSTLGRDWHESTRPVLGSAQLGRSYGIANKFGMPSPDGAESILNEAWARGVRVIDTARGYGVSEERIGAFLKKHPDRNFSIVTKILPFDGSTEISFAEQIEASVSESLRALCLSELSTVLLHRASMLDTRAWDKLIELKSVGLIHNIGVSVQTPEEFMVAASTPDLTHIQFPFNILDFRWKESGIDSLVASRSDLVVHARSIYLQGLLSAEGSVRWPDVNDFRPAKVLSAIRTLVCEFGRESAADLCYAFVRGQRWINSSVIGMETREQVIENTRLASRRSLNSSELEEVTSRIPRVPVQLLNPALWPRF